MDIVFDGVWIWKSRPDATACPGPTKKPPTPSDDYSIDVGSTHAGRDLGRVLLQFPNCYYLRTIVCLLLKQALFYSILLSNDSHPLPPWVVQIQPHSFPYLLQIALPQHLSTVSTTLQTPNRYFRPSNA